MREKLIVFAVAVLVAGGSFVAGRYSAPGVVQTRDVERVVYKDKIVEKIVTVEVEKKAETKVVYRDRVITQDRIVEREVERTDTKVDTETRDTGETVATRDGETVREVTRTVTLRPDWRVTVQAGASLNAPLVPIAGPLVLGVELDRRIIGGLSVGVWVNTSGAAGAAVAMEF